jgi:plastocyanin
MTIIEGVDTTQNTNITIATNAATAAFAQANATAGGLTTANSRIDVVEGVNTSQNTRMGIIEGVDLTQNTNITNADTKAQAAFTQANTVYLPSVTRLDVTHSGSSAYLLDQYSGNNPTIYINAGETIAFNLNVSGHPFMIRVSSGGSNYDTGLTHITNAGDVTTGSNAQGKVSGILFWKVPFDIAGNTYVYQCSAHAGMVGSITIGQPSSIVLSTLQGVNTTQNTRLSSIETINTTQNTNISIIQGVDLTQNTRIGSIETINTDQNTAISIIQGVNITQNTNISIIQGVDLTQNTNITIADSKAQAAFDFANTISGGSAIDNVARASVNTATTLAQAAFNKANDAYTLANTANAAAGSGGASLTSFTTTVDNFTGNGSQTTFTLSVTPDSEDSTFVFLNGVYQEKSTYSVSGSSLILTDVATANDDIEVTTVSGSIMNVSPSAYSTRIYQGDGSTNTFTISSGHTANTIMVFNNGVCQFPVDDYTVSNTTLTYVLTPESDETIQIRELPINKLVPLTYQMRRYTANGVQTQFTVTAGQTANSTFVFENGICQVPISDYTISGATLTFVTAPVANVIIQIREASI